MPEPSGEQETSRPSGKSSLLLPLFAVLCVIAGGIGQSMGIMPGMAIMFWPPVGMLMGVLVANPRQTWKRWIAASLIAELVSNLLWLHHALPLALAYAGTNIAEALAGALLIRRYVPHAESFEVPEQVLRFIGCCLIAPFISATLLSAIDAAIGKRAFESSWPILWASDAAGIITAAPLTLVTIDLWRRREKLRAFRVLETLLLGLLLLSLAAIAYAGMVPTFYMVLPFIMWAGMRFEIRGVVTAMAVLVLEAALFTSHKAGAFAPGPNFELNAVRVQIFFVVATISGLFAATLAYQSRRAHQQLAAINAELEARVADRSNRLMVALRAGGLGVMEYDFATGSVLLDATARELWGLPEGIASFCQLEALIEPRDLARAAAALFEAQSASGTGRLTVEFRVGGRHLSIDADTSFRNGVPVAMIGTVKDITGRREGERRQQMLIDELSHRVKNTLATVQAIAMQSLRGGSDRLARDAFVSRLRVYARGHDLLAKQKWQSASLDDLVRQIIVPHGVERFNVSPAPEPIFLPARQALAVTLALHELATNAAKYGALSRPEGTVAISWSCCPAGDFRLIWQERGGPPPGPPNPGGFGTRLLQRGLALELAGNVDLDFQPSGLVCTITAPLPVEPQRAAIPVELAG